MRLPLLTDASLLATDERRARQARTEVHVPRKRTKSEVGDGEGSERDDISSQKASAGDEEITPGGIEARVEGVGREAFF